MLPETLQLEQLRQKIEDIENELGSMSDYLDRGKPNAAQQKQTHEQMAKLTNQSKELKSNLQDLIVSIRSSRPEAITEWVNVHKTILEQVLADNAKDRDANTRKHVARGTLNEWDKVLAGEQVYVGINWYFLKEYKNSVRKDFGAPQTSNKNSNSKNDKGWWQFWK